MPFRMNEFREVTTAGWIGATQCGAVGMFDQPLHFDTSDPAPLKQDPPRPGRQCGNRGNAIAITHAGDRYAAPASDETTATTPSASMKTPGKPRPLLNH